MCNLATLRGKHPTEDPAAIASGKAQAERRAGITAVGGQEQQPNVTPEPLAAQGQIPEMENLFEEATVKAVIKKANPQSAAGPSGLRYSHLQAALCDELVEDLAAFATLVFSSRVLPQVFWTLHTSANLSALGQKARPVACGDVLRRVIGAVFCRRYGRKLADYFQPWGQYGVAVSGGVEIMAFTATLGFEEGCTILSYDGANAFNSIYRHRFLPALAEIVPSVVPYASNLYAREPPKLLFALDGGGLEVVESARGVQQGCNLGPLCYSAGSLKILKEFKANPPVPGARAVSFIDDITGHSTTGIFSRYGRDRESYGMAAGTPGGRRHLAEPKEIAGPASRWSWARTTDGRAARGNGYHRAHGGPTGDEGCGSTSWNRTVSARFLTGGG